MGQSLVKNYIHIIYSTKHREALIREPIEFELYSCLGRLCNTEKCYPLKIGGYLDHVHILCNLSKNIALSQFLQRLKSKSSKWIKEKGGLYSNFYWQDGYGAFSVSPSKLDSVINYIANQHQHHKKISFRDEYCGILKKHGLEINEHVWD